MFEPVGLTGLPHIHENRCKWGPDGSPRAHTLSARSHDLYEAFGTNSPNIRTFSIDCCWKSMIFRVPESRWSDNTAKRQYCLNQVKRFRLVALSIGFPSDFHMAMASSFPAASVVAFPMSAMPIRGTFGAAAFDNLDKKMETWKETFLSMLIHIAFKTEGVVNDCDVVMEESNKYRISQDHLMDFVQNRIIVDEDPDVYMTKITLKNEYDIYCQQNNILKKQLMNTVYQEITKNYGVLTRLGWRGIKISQDGYEDA